MKVVVVRSVMFDSTVYGAVMEASDEELKTYSYGCIRLVEQGTVTLGSTKMILRELADTPAESLRSKLLELYVRLNKIELAVDEEATSLAGKYLEKLRLDMPKVDALLIMCSMNGIDALISWNRRHLVNQDVQKVVKRLNDNLGFKTSLVITPKQLIEQGKFSLTSGGVMFVSE